MKLKLTLRGEAQGTQDIQITADATATVGDVAAALAAATNSPLAQGGSGVTMRVSEPSGRTTTAMSPKATLLDSGIRSGSFLDLVTPEPRSTGRGKTVALLRVLSGPDAGIEVPLPTGASDIGRSAECDVHLSDPQVSKKHARINIGDRVEVVDTNSSNGVIVGGTRVGRVQLGPGDTAILGNTTIAVTLHGTVDAVESLSTDIPFVRPPRVVPRVPARTIALPEVPRPSEPAPFPWLAMVAPLVMGGVMFGTTRSAMSLIFVALSPILMLGNYIDTRLRAKRKHADELTMFEAEMVGLRNALESDHDEERSAMLAAYPSLESCLAAIPALDGLLWSRRAEHPQFLQLRLGIGDIVPAVTLEGTRAGGTPQLADRLAATVSEFDRLRAAPVVADLRSCGSLGLCGDRAVLDGVARGIVAQAVVLHSPAELVVAVMTSAAGLDRWDWMQWLPHTSSPHSPLGLHLAADPAAGTILLNDLEALVDARAGADSRRADHLRGPLDGPEKPTTPVVPSVLVVVDTPAVDRSRLTRLAEKGADVGVHLVWCAARRADLPGACRTYLEVSERGNRVGHVRFGQVVEPVQCEALDVRTAMGLARRLAPVVDTGAPVSDASDLPRSVPVVSLLDPDTVDDPAQVVARWRQNRSLVVRDGRPPTRLDRAGDLAAIVGHAGTEAFTIDLRAHGPHALVGGTTGAGKSEFLQAWVLGLAHAYSPDRVTFLFVDYKGGSAFSHCTKLPHNVGLVTDLSPHLVRRALRSLRAELRHREELLSKKGAKDLIELEVTGDPECPPSLIIVIDEFAALVGEVPEFVDGVVDVAQRGRSLGLHLILATQRPAGVIKDNLRANTNLRVALRMADEHESTDVLGDKMAAHFDPSVPGRGAAKTGPGRITQFQSAFPGSRTPAEPPAPPIDVVELGFGVTARWRMPERATPAKDIPKDIERVVATVRAAAQQARIPEPRRPWLDSLARTYNLEKLLQRSDDALALGVLDDPDRQDQYTEYFRPDEDGNILYYGAGGSGKSTALRTLAVAASITPRSAGAQVYAIDFASGALSMLESLPHVGAVISGDDEERVTRLIKRLREVVDARREKFKPVRAATLAEFRASPDGAREQRILLLLDGFGTFRTEFESTTERLATYNAFQQLLVDGRSVGVHVAMTADRPTAVPTSVASAFQRKVVLRQVDEDAYAYLGVPKDVLTPTSPPGRALQADKPMELQLAILGDDVSMAAQSRAVDELAAENAGRIVARPEPVRSLPALIPATALPASVAGRPLLGMADDTLGVVTFEPAGTILVAGPAQSGRTNAVRWLSESVRRAFPDTAQIHLAARRSPLSELGSWTAHASGVEACAELAAKVRPTADQPGGETAPVMAIFVENLPEFVGTAAETPVLELVKLSRRNGHILVAEGETTTWVSPWPLVQEVRNGRTGILLQPDQADGDSLLRTSLPRVRRTDLPPGRGFYVRAGRARKIQLPLLE